jgi:hypothetical protein
MGGLDYRMPRKRETGARRLVAELYRATDGRPLRWCSLSEIAERTQVDAEAVYYAVQQDWIQLSPGPEPHSITLTEEGRQLGASRPARGRPKR